MANNCYFGTIQSIDPVRSFALRDGGTGTEQGFWLSAEVGNYKSAKHFVVRNAKVSIPQPDEKARYCVYFDLISNKWNDKVFDKCEVWKIENVLEAGTNTTTPSEPAPTQQQGAASPAGDEELPF